MNASNPFSSLPSPSCPSRRIDPLECVMHSWAHSPLPDFDPDYPPEPDPINEEHACDQLAEYWVRAGNGAIR